MLLHVRTGFAEDWKLIRDLGEIHGGISRSEQLRIASRSNSPTELESTIAACRSLEQGISSDDVLRHLGGEMLREPRDRHEQLPDVRRRLMGTVTAVKWLVEGPPLISDRLLRSEGGAVHLHWNHAPKDYGTLGGDRTASQDRPWAAGTGKTEFPEVQMGLTGKLQADEIATSDRDMTRAALLAIILVAIVIMLVLGAIWHPLHAMAAFGCAAGWTYGLVGLTVGQLNLLSIVFMLVLIGVGLDFGVHVISRYANSAMLQRSGGIGTRSVQDRHEGKRVRSHDVERDFLRGMVH